MIAKYPMPIGIEDFRDLVLGNYYFVDKTRFIKELLDNRKKVTLITRPRRFGKTLTLSMLRYFFSSDSAETNRELFQGLDIDSENGKYMKEQGTRPVINLTLKDIRSDNWEGELEKIALFLSRLYGNHLHLKDSQGISDIDREYFISIRKTQANRAMMEEALLRLCQMLEAHYGKKAVLLIDEYDAPIIAAWEHGYYDKCIEFMRGLLSNALKTNDSLDFAVLTGVTRVSKESIFSGLNNLKVCSVLSDQYSDILGFT